MYRAWAEIMKDGKRVERSGLVGPRFVEADAAEHMRSNGRGSGSTVNAARRLQPKPHLQSTPPRVARPLPAMRHVPEPVTVNHGGPLHGPLNAFRGPLRRYPGEPAAHPRPKAVHQIVSRRIQNSSPMRDERGGQHGCKRGGQHGCKRGG